MPIFKAVKKILDKGDDLDYRGSHTAPDADYGAPLHDLTQMIPEDVYGPSGERLYGLGDTAVDREAFNALRRARGNPDLEIPVFRAVPEGVEDMNVGDWVTTSREYAKIHGDNVLDGKYDVLEASVPAQKLISEGYPYEFGIIRSMAPAGVSGMGLLSALPQEAEADPMTDGIGFEPQMGFGDYMQTMGANILDQLIDIRGNVGDGTLYGNEYR